MLIGEFSHTIDEKGRVRIPKNFRDDLGETFYITKGFDKCLFVYPEEGWKVFMQKLENNDATSKEVRQIQRFFTGSAMSCKLDSQGRTLISQALRNFGNLNKEVIVIGMNDHVEIWSADRWSVYNEDMDDIDDIADKSDEFKFRP